MILMCVCLIGPPFSHSCEHSLTLDFILLHHPVWFWRAELLVDVVVGMIRNYSGY